MEKKPAGTCDNCGGDVQTMLECISATTARECDKNTDIMRKILNNEIDSKAANAALKDSKKATKRNQQCCQHLKKVIGEKSLQL